MNTASVFGQCQMARRMVQTIPFGFKSLGDRALSLKSLENQISGSKYSVFESVSLRRVQLTPIISRATQPV